MFLVLLLSAIAAFGCALMIKETFAA
jgi:hypothetical protein